MKILIAMDSFKGSLSSMEAGRAVEEGIRRANLAKQRLAHMKIEVKPLADGGEGTTEALVEGLGGQMVSVEVTGPFGERITSQYGILPDGKTAVMEMAAAAGIVLVQGEKRPFDATTYGVGEMIRDAITRGCREFIVGIGGSATNDGGLGMLSALGFDFLDDRGERVPLGAKGLSKVQTIRKDNVFPQLKECRFRVACDVTNPLCGENGATYVYGPQKGVKETQKEELDAAMRQYAKKAAEWTGYDCKDTAGAGAAGGMGFAFLSFLDAKLQSGIELVMEAVGLEESMQGADYVVTGEGRLDGQSAMGKAPVGVARAAKRKGARVIALAGSLGHGANQCNEAGIDAFFPIVPGIVSLEEAMNTENARDNLSRTAEQIFRLL